jgi:hypothetical protein
MASDSSNDDSLYPIAVLIDELRNEDVQVKNKLSILSQDWSMILLMACLQDTYFMVGWIFLPVDTK